MVEAASGWHWRCLWRAPHRLAFAAATLLLLLASLWWGLQLLAWTAGPALPLPTFRPAFAPAIAHGAVMVFGCLPLFFAGFVFTVAPKWLRVSAPPVEEVARLVLLQLVGWLLWLSGWSAPWSAGAGLGLALPGLLLQYWRLASMWLASAEPDRLHAGCFVVAGLVGVVSLTGLCWAWLQGDVALARAWLQTGLWGFVFVTFAAAAHRMVPVLSSDHLPGRWQSWSMLCLLLACAVIKVTLAWSDQSGAFHAPSELFGAAVLLIAGVTLLWVARVWARVQSLGQRMMAMLHAAFVWLALAWLLDAAALLGPRFGWQLGSLAALHACAMGFMTTVMLAMVERVSCGHGGHKLTFAGRVWWAFWLLQAATLARVSTELRPVWLPAGLLLAVSLWLLALLPWCLRLLRWYGSPRPDGRPG